MVALGLGALLSTGLSALVPRVTDLLPSVGVLAPVGTTLVTVAINTGIFLVAFQALTARHLGWRNVLAGALIAAALWQLLQTLGVYYFDSYLNRQSDVYGLFGVILGLIAWIYLQALVVVLAAEINVVRQHRLFPRALLTPFTDDVDLTGPDICAYTNYACSERYKAFERVEATFQREEGTSSPPRQERTDGPSGDGQG